jgi:methylated-DNA-[protein]-cysteine S-methyltransferase
MKDQKTINPSPFASAVYKLTGLIPLGKVATYGQIARKMGKPKAARAVGQALHCNPLAPKVPCHRVVQSNGDLGGFAGGLKKKTILLRQEGIVIKDNRLDLNKYQAKL